MSGPTNESIEIQRQEAYRNGLCEAKDMAWRRYKSAGKTNASLEEMHDDLLRACHQAEDVLSTLRAAGLAPCDAPLPGRIAEWPKERRVGRREDMSPTGHLEVVLDGDSDVIVCVTTGSTVDDFAQASVEFCTAGVGGGSSPRTRAALIALMLAIEADNAESPRKQWPPAEDTDGVNPSLNDQPKEPK